MEFTNDTSKEVCGAQGITIVRSAKTKPSFRPELHSSKGRRHITGDTTQIPSLPKH
jgi:hypothetical protein